MLMEIRDTRRNAEHFKDVIESLEHRIKRNLDRIDAIPPGRVPRVKQMIWNFRFSIVQCQYCLGFVLEDLSDEVEELFVEAGGLDWVTNTDYSNRSWIASLGLIFDIDVELFGNIALFSETTPQGKRHALFSRLYEQKHELPPQARELQVDPDDEGLVAVIDLAEAGKTGEASEALTKYVQRWYVKNQGMGWYNSHDTNNYKGYWAYEAAAVARQWKIDDTAIKDHQYYPYDLAHYQPAA